VAKQILIVRAFHGIENLFYMGQQFSTYPLIVFIVSIVLLLGFDMHNEIFQYIQNKLHVYGHYFRDRLDVRNYNYCYDGRCYTIVISKGCLVMYTNGRQPYY
jgi:hypothetical protein